AGPQAGCAALPSTAGRWSRLAGLPRTFVPEGLSFVAPCRGAIAGEDVGSGLARRGEILFAAGSRFVRARIPTQVVDVASVDLALRARRRELAARVDRRHQTVRGGDRRDG